MLELTKLNPDGDAMLYVWREGRSAPSPGRLINLIPRGLEAMRDPAATVVEIELSDGRRLDADTMLQLLTRWIGGTNLFHVDLAKRQVFYQRSNTAFTITDGDGLDVLFAPPGITREDLALIHAGGMEALRQERERDPRAVGALTWHQA